MNGAPVAEVLRQESVCLGGGGADARAGWNRVLGGPGPGHRWRTLKAVLKVTARVTVIVMQRRLSLEAELGYSGPPSGGCVTLGKSFPVLQPWLSPAGWHKDAARIKVADAPQMLRLVPGSWGRPAATLLDVVAFNVLVGTFGLCRPYPVLITARRRARTLLSSILQMRTLRQRCRTCLGLLGSMPGLLP